MNGMVKRKNIRLKGYDYASDSYYFVTVCCSHNVAAERSSANNSKAKRFAATGKAKRFAATDRYKYIIEKHLKNMGNHNGVELDYFKLMPDHLHFILILKDAKLPLWRYIQDFKSKTTLEIKKKGFVSKRFWQPNYYEHVIRNEKALMKIRKYIENNPLVVRIKFEQFYETGLVNDRREE